MPLHASHVSRTWDKILTTAYTHVVSEMPEVHRGPLPRIIRGIAEPWSLSRPLSKAITCRPLENAGEYPYQRPIGPPEKDVSGAVRQDHDDDLKHRITDRDVLEGTRSIPIVDVDCPRLEHLAPSDPGWPAYKNKKKTSAGDVFREAREKRIFPIGPPMKCPEALREDLRRQLRLLGILLLRQLEDLQDPQDPLPLLCGARRAYPASEPRLRARKP